jgi:integrase
MAKAHKLPSGSWRVRVFGGYDPDGKKIYRSFTHPDKKEAEFQATQFAARHKEISRDSGNMTLDEAMQQYIADRENVLSPATIRGYDNIRRNHLDALMRVRLNKITTMDIQKAINAEARTLSPKTIANVNGLVTAVFGTYAPNALVGSVALPQKKKPENRALSKKEIAVLLNGIDGDRIEIPILLALWLGLRRSEIMALKWDDINFDKRTLRIDEAMVMDRNGKLVVKGTKTTDSARTLKLPPYIQEKLMVLPRETEFVFKLTEDALTGRFPKICRNLGIEQYKFHDLRRSMATVGMSLNIADKLMMSRGGWSNIQTMKNIYQQVLQESEDEADLALNAYFEKLIRHEI